MKRLCVGCVAVLLTVVPLLAFAQGSSAQKTEPSKKTLSATGTVSAITETSLSIKVKTGELTFAVDKETNVIGRGAGTKGAELKKGGKPAVITEFVSVGDTVVVRYHDTGTTKHAASVRITAKATK